jgi:MFS transporter, ACS family, tartrate transporter
MSIPSPSALDRARRKAYLRLIPLLFACYVIAYVDRSNVAIAKLTMSKDMPAFNDEVIGFGAGVFFWGYFLLEIPGTLLVEKWSARKWISRIMVSWGIVAALTSLVTDPWHFYLARFCLGLAEAGFFPGVIVYLTHWFPVRDRARALSWFLIATPVAQIFSPKLSNLVLHIGTTEKVAGQMVHIPPFLGLVGWQWVYIAWGIPAVILGFLVLAFLTDRPRNARWLEPDERDALDAELEREKANRRAGGGHMTVLQAFRNPKVLLLTAAYFFIVTGNYGFEYFMPTILKEWYTLDLNQVTWLVVLPPIGSLVGQLFIGWNSDRTKERRLHASLPILFGAVALATSVWTQQWMWTTVALFILAVTGLKAYLPAFWSLPSLFLTEAAAAGSIGLINSVGNLGGFVGSFMMGWLKKNTGSFSPGMLFLAASMAVSATIIIALGLGRQVAKPAAEPEHLVKPEAVIEPV